MSDMLFQGFPWNICIIFNSFLLPRHTYLKVAKNKRPGFYHILYLKFLVKYKKVNHTILLIPRYFLKIETIENIT